MFFLRIMAAILAVCIFAFGVLTYLSVISRHSVRSAANGALTWTMNAPTELFGMLSRISSDDSREYSDTQGQPKTASTEEGLASVPPNPDPEDARVIEVPANNGSGKNAAGTDLQEPSTPELPVVTIPGEPSAPAKLPELTPGTAVFIGDSIGVSLLDNGLAKAFGEGWTVVANAAGSRAIKNSVPSSEYRIIRDGAPVKVTGKPLNGYSQIKAMRESLDYARAVVIQLGTNGEADFLKAVNDMAARTRALAQKARIYWVNVYDPRDESETKRRNQLIHKVSHHNRYGFEIIDWHRLASNSAHGSWFADDPMRLHPNIGGARALINLIANELLA